MRDADLPELTSLVADTYHLLSQGRQTPSPKDIALFFAALAQHDIADIRTAFLRHIGDEARGRFLPTPADILAKISRRAAHPGAEEAWAMCIRGAADERDTVVWTNVMREAFHAAARPLLDLGDQIAARMAFKESYARLLATAGAPQWEVSIGWDQELRTVAIEAAVKSQQLTAEDAAHLLPSPALQLDMLPAPDNAVIAAATLANIARLREALGKGFDRRAVQAAAERERFTRRKAETRESIEAYQAHVDAANAEVGRIAHG